MQEFVSNSELHSILQYPQRSKTLTWLLQCEDVPVEAAQIDVHSSQVSPLAKYDHSALGIFYFLICKLLIKQSGYEHLSKF